MGSRLVGNDLQSYEGQVDRNKGLSHTVKIESGLGATVAGELLKSWLGSNLVTRSKLFRGCKSILLQPIPNLQFHSWM